MKEKTPYWQKLLDPRWQKLRLEVFQRDQFKCAWCGAAESTLHVHHEYYVGGREPWEYPLSAFTTLCAEHHKDATEIAGGVVYDWEYFIGLNARCAAANKEGHDFLQMVSDYRQGTEMGDVMLMELLVETIKFDLCGYNIISRLRVMVDEAKHESENNRKISEAAQ